ncbi:hypothetical protein [Nocardioides sp. YIM 152315]|uniref:hypothetical protein n=1 Tax=Nocardioides sp. YIM 152315 TaxID=3031760 RepID=UPI0023D9FB36|nr:hypothetical protein [Nocardioides sp. YIM 152315]MDF1605196.1 hypothetical protein [Nocardioides sp. YIM 152315]
MTRTLRLAAGLVSGTVALGLAVGTMAAASAAPDDRSAAWLAKQPEKGVVSVTSDGFTFDDYGLTADLGTALSVIGGQKKTVRQVDRALQKHVDSWTTGVDFGSRDVFAGSAAKALVFAQTVGADPKDFGGVNLVKRVAGRVSTEKGIVGRVQDKTADTDYANVIGQSYAAAGLSEAGSRKARPAVRFLLRQQCAPGYFRLLFADADAKDQTCDGARKRDRKADTDATALAVLNLQSIDKPSRAVESAVDAAVAWLVQQQKADGSLGGGTATKGRNSNSTGLGAWALGRAGKCDAAEDAAAWVNGLRRGSGAIAYDEAAEKAGIRKATLGQWVRATAQAAPGLRYLSGC